MVQMKEQCKIPEEQNEVEISLPNNLPNKEFKLKIIKMLNKLRRRMDENQKKFKSYMIKGELGVPAMCNGLRIQG